MTRNLLLAVLLLFACACVAQAANTQPSGENKEDGKEEAPPVPPEIPADYADFVRKTFPGVDPTGEHNLFDLKNPADPAKRHDYTANMARLVLLYLQELQMGSSLLKLFDHYGRGKQGENPTFKVLHAIVMLQFPPGKPNISEASKLLREAAETHKDFAYAWYYIAQVEMIGGQQESRGTKPALEALDKALSIRKDFIQALVLKAQILINMKPPRNSEVLKFVEPVLKGPLPPDADDYSDLLQMYFAVAGAEAFKVIVNEHLKRPEMTDRFRLRALVLQANAHMALNQYDDAIGWLERARALVSVKTEPRAAQQLARNLAICWASKAMATKNDKELFQKFADEAHRYHLEAAEVERRNMPVSLRGPEAVVYVDFLVRAMSRVEQAIQWLRGYLDDTDLMVAQRYRLENILAFLEDQVDPNEARKVERLRNQYAQKDWPQIARTLDEYRNGVRQGNRFESMDAVSIFLELLNTPERGVERTAAFLAADTAANIGAEAVSKAGAALVQRFKKEIECKTDDQAALQNDFSEAMRLLTEGRPVKEHGPVVEFLRHLADIVEAVELPTLLTKVMPGWTLDEFLKRYKHAPRKLGGLNQRKADASAKWLRELADAIEKEIKEE